MKHTYKYNRKKRNTRYNIEFFVFIYHSFFVFMKI